MGHVIRRMRSGRVRIFNGNQWETVQSQKDKGQGHKVTWRISRQKRYNSAVYGQINFKRGENYRRDGRRVWYTF